MEADEEDVLEGDNDNSSVDKDSEIEKLKKEVVDLTRGFEKEIVDLTEKHKESSFFYREMYNKFQRGLKYDPTVDLPSSKIIKPFQCFISCSNSQFEPANRRRRRK